MDNIIMVDNSQLMGSLKRMKDRGEITLEDYAASLRRYKELVAISERVKQETYDMCLKINHIDRMGCL